MTDTDGKRTWFPFLIVQNILEEFVLKDVRNIQGNSLMNLLNLSKGLRSGQRDLYYMKYGTDGH